MTNSTLLNDGPVGERIAVAIVSLFGILLNSTAVLVLLTNFTRIFSRAEACFVTNLALADLLTSVGGLLWGIHPSVNFSDLVTDILMCILWITVSASFLTLLCMGCERLLVVVNPMKAQRFFKKPFAYVCCAAVWFVSVLTGSMINVDAPVAVCVMTVMFEVSLVVTISCYIRIYITVRRLRRDSHRSAARYNADNANLNIELEENEFALHHRVTVKQESRVTNLVFVLLMILSVTVLPYMILMQVNIAYVLHCPRCSERYALIKAQNYLFPLEMVNFVLNPVVYAWWLPKFRQASKRTFRRFICCKTQGGAANMGVQGEYSTDSGSLANNPAPIFTGREETCGTSLNNNGNS